MIKNTGAGYRPQEFIIRLGKEIQLLDTDDDRLVAPTAAALAVFMHEYMHYIHNVSTVTGLYGFVNTLGLWRLFRETFDESGYSRGSSQLDFKKQNDLKVIMGILAAGRDVFKPKLNNVPNPVSLQILKATWQSDIEINQQTILTKIVCEAEVSDQGGNVESCQIEIGIPEIMEGAAWLLESSLLSKLDPDADELPGKLFPYKAVSALAEYLHPGMASETVLAAILAALQSSDPIDALKQILKIASDEYNSGRNAIAKIDEAAKKVVTENEATLTKYLSEIDDEFSSTNHMAFGIRAIISAARETLNLRQEFPLFEIYLMDVLAQRRITFEQWMKEYPSCIVIQQNAGNVDVLKRDRLASFLLLNEDDSDPEDGLRVVHATFDFVGRHIRNGEFVPTSQLAAQPCPFFTCCDLDLRKYKAAICGSSPWQSADDDGRGKCWYGQAVAITRPPTEGGHSGDN